MPKASSRKAPGRIALKKESLSSASQLSAFGIRVAKFTYRFSGDGASDFLSNYELPTECVIKSVSVYSENGVTNASTVNVQAGGNDLNNAAVDFSLINGAVIITLDNPIESGELGLVFGANPPQAGECTIAVEYIDLSEIK
jgi:hypothetical protein